VTTPGKYVVVSPVKNETAFVLRTLESICRQTVRPHRWVIVDDGSTDGTSEILERFASANAWIRLVRRDPGAPRQPGSRVIQNFQVGYDLLRDDDFDFVVKLDCDLDIPPDYFEQMLKRFDDDASLGIASGVYLERRDDEWVPVALPAYHAAGAMKMVRAECFRAIGGFVASPGWDTVDEIKAQVRGWTTKHFPDLQVLHLKDEGSGVGFLKMSRMSGEIHYLTGGGALFFWVKALHRLLFGRPFITGSLAMVTGYVTCVMTRRQKLVDAREVDYYRKLLDRRMFEAVLHPRLPKLGERGARYS
jgi:glycosyltransferase involved in cell wall biosynthesis